MEDKRQILNSAKTPLSNFFSRSQESAKISVPMLENVPMLKAVVCSLVFVTHEGFYGVCEMNCLLHCRQ